MSKQMFWLSDTPTTNAMQTNSWEKQYNYYSQNYNTNLCLPAVHFPKSHSMLPSFGELTSTDVLKRTLEVSFTLASRKLSSAVVNFDFP